MSENCCQAPQSITNIYNNTATLPTLADLVVNASLQVTLPSLAVQGGILAVFLDAVLQIEDTNFTVDYLTGIITFIGATDGQKAHVLYVEA